MPVGGGADLLVAGPPYAAPVAPVTQVWIDGEVLDADRARVSPFDNGLLTGDGVFETLRVYRGEPFAARRHLERLALSAAAMGLPCPPPDVMRQAMADVVAANGLVAGRLRITVTGGPSSLGSGRGDAGPTVIVAGGPIDRVAVRHRGGHRPLAPQRAGLP